MNWVCAALPFRGRDLARAVSLSERLLAEHGFEPLLACLCTAPRSVNFVPLIVYDRDEDGADARAATCHDALYAALAELGYLPYRLGSQSSSRMPRARDNREEIIERIRGALDPASVFVKRYTR